MQDDDVCGLFGCQVYGCKNKAEGGTSFLVKGIYVSFFTCGEHTGRADVLIDKLWELKKEEEQEK